MLCILCEGKTKSELVEHKEYGVSLGKYKAEVCSKCGEAYYNSEIAEKIQKKSKELGLFGLSKKTKVAKVGNSYAIRVPKPIADFVNLKRGKEVTIFPKGKNTISIEF